LLTLLALLPALLLLTTLLAALALLALLAALLTLLLALVALALLATLLLAALLVLGLAALLRLALLALLAVHFVEAAIERVALHVHDLFELALDVIEDGVEVELIELLAALLPELLEEVAQSLHAVAVGVAHAALEQIAERVLEVTEVHEVVGEVIENVVRFEGWDFLGAVPHRVAEFLNHELPPAARPAGEGGLCG
jgi:hypothetical protein